MRTLWHLIRGHHVEAFYALWGRTPIRRCQECRIEWVTWRA